MPSKCNACGRFTNSSEGVKCAKCACYYHRPCVNIPKDVKVVPAWLCPGCKALTPRKDNTENPIRGEGADYDSTQSGPEGNVTVEILREIRLMRQDMKSFRDDFNTLRDNLSVLRGAVEGMGGRIDSLEKRIECLEKKGPEMQVTPDVSNLLLTIEQLKCELNDRDQESFLNDVEISGILEEQGENVGHLVCMIAEKLGVACEERDVVSVERAGVRRAPSAGEPTTVPRPRLVVVRLARRQVRDAFLQAARVRRGITTEGLGLAAAPARLYVNERLSKHNKMLFFKAREEARSHGWKYVWTKGGRILVRRESGKASFRVRSEVDLTKIFGGETAQ